MPLLIPFIRKLHDQDGILGRESDQRHQANLEIDIIRHPLEPHGTQRTEQSDRDRQNDRKGHYPALILGSEHQEHHQQSKPEGVEGLIPDHPLLIRNAAPVDSVPLRHQDFFCQRIERIQHLP